MQQHRTWSPRFPHSRARGRNRREAARIAEIIPPVIVTEIDPKLAVHRSNNQNRDATPGQKAMATAMAFPEAKRGGDRKTDVFKSLQNDLNQSERNAISRARGRKMRLRVAF